jgi:hypothetical protein
VRNDSEGEFLTYHEEYDASKQAYGTGGAGDRIPGGVTTFFRENPTLHVVGPVGTYLSRDFGEGKRKELKNVVRVTGNM